MTYLTTHSARVTILAGEHVALVTLALLVALALAFPLGIAIVRRPRLAPWMLGSLGALYTIPSLAVLALLVQLVGLGNAPIFVALVVYAQFILVRNIVAGINGIDNAQRDAACGLGMSPRQLLLRVELPLAAPVIVGGVRIASVAMIALATLGGYVGGSGLGTLIFTGLTLHHTDMIVAGASAASLLAIAADGCLRLTERVVAQR